jgi:hypothetical protein
MPPKHRQLRTPQPKLAGNAYQSLVDLPEDRFDPTFDGRDGKVDRTDDNTIVIPNPCDSGPPASQQLQHNEWVQDNIVLLSKQINFNGDDMAKRFINMENRLLSIKADQLQHSDALRPHGNGDPPPAFSTTSTKTIDFSIGFGFAAFIYVSL